VNPAGGTQVDARLLAEIEEIPMTADPAAERRRQAKQLTVFAGGERAPIEDLRAGFLRRLHQASDDYAATEGLRTVELALSMLPR
jgi:hypothetical protein